MEAGKKRSRPFSATKSLSRPRLPETVSKTRKQTKTTSSLLSERKKRIKECVVGTAVLIPFFKEDVFITIYVMCVLLRDFMCTGCLQEPAEARSRCMLLCVTLLALRIEPRYSEEQPVLLVCWSGSPALFLSMCFDSRVHVAESFLSSHLRLRKRTSSLEGSEQKSGNLYLWKDYLERFKE